ncbi:MAG: helical backbone metal receptor [Bacteroidota bacterium]
MRTKFPIKVIDQLGESITLNSIPKRIISLVPSQTEYLFDLGLGDHVVGVTKFCIHPGEAKDKTIIGGTKKFRFDVIDRLKPDLIIGNKEENYLEGITRLKKKYPVWVSDILTINHALDMMKSLGAILNVPVKANDMVSDIQKRFGELNIGQKKKALYFIWREPYMAVGCDTFIDEMLSYAGFENLAAHMPRYPEIAREELFSWSPDVVLLSSEPYPFKEKHLEGFQQYFPDAQIKLVDGEVFSWYGSRLLSAPKYFNDLAQSLSING